MIKMTKKELLKKYEKGEKDFRMIECYGEDISNCIFRDCNFAGARFERCDLSFTTFDNTNLSNASFNHSKIFRGRFHNSILTSTSFFFCYCLGANFTLANLEKTRLHNSNFDATTFHLSKMTAAHSEWTTFIDTVMIKVEDATEYHCGLLVD